MVEIQAKHGNYPLEKGKYYKLILDKNTLFKDKKYQPKLIYLNAKELYVVVRYNHKYRDLNFSLVATNVALGEFKFLAKKVEKIEEFDMEELPLFINDNTTDLYEKLLKEQ